MWWNKRFNKTLLATLAFSLALHVLLIARYSGLDWAWVTDKNSTPIEVKLEPKPKPPTAVAKAEPPPEIKPQPKPKPAPEPEPQAVEETPPPVEEAVVAESPETFPQPPIMRNQAISAEALPPETSVEAPVNAPTDELPMAQENQVGVAEIDFKLFHKGGGAGTEHHVYSRDGARYVLTSVAKPDWLHSLVVSELTQQSDGQVTEQGLKPSHYSYQYGKNQNKWREAVFDWEQNTLTMQYGARKQQEPLVEGAQDMMSFMYQFMFMPPLSQMELAITNGKRLKIYDYSFEGEEEIELPFGKVNSLHIVHLGTKGEEKTELWLVPNYHYLPLRFRMTEEDGAVWERIATQVTIK
ncbi:MAG: DUF3108 domain-containing protein [Methylobacillus sp.]|jgi:hypothetical protein|nr:DUF3108 domain-containing protein [Methylobacillus sp.]